METPGVPAPLQNPTLDTPATALTEYELRNAIMQHDRHFMQVAGDVELRRMSEVLTETQFRRYIELCRALRFKTRVTASVHHRKNDATKS